MKCELLAEHNLALLLDFVDDENTKYYSQYQTSTKMKGADPQ